MNLKPKPIKKFPSPGKLLILNNNGEDEPLLGFSSSFDDVLLLISVLFLLYFNERSPKLVEDKPAVVRIEERYEDSDTTAGDRI